MDTVSDAPIPLITKQEFLDDVRAAIRAGSGYAAGKIGDSEKRIMYFPRMLASGVSARQRKAYELTLPFYFQRQAGLFPTSPEFIRTYAEFFVEQVRQVDCLGLFLQEAANHTEEQLLRAYQLTSKFIYYQNQEPDRSIPDNPANCYLPSLAGKRLVLVCPFAELLRERANRETFERVWSRTGKRWFYPAGVQAVEFPYGYDRSTQAQYATCSDLLQSIEREIAAREFDVALIAAGGMGIPLAAFVKQLGKVGIALGGHLQVLFGVTGKRWRNDPLWRDTYFNADWIDMPARYKPQAEDVTDYGAYW